LKRKEPPAKIGRLVLRDRIRPVAQQALSGLFDQNVAPIFTM
jgi:hypothetical protein